MWLEKQKQKDYDYLRNNCGTSFFNGLASAEHVWQKLSLILGSQQRQKIKIDCTCNANKKTKDARNYLQRIESRRKKMINWT